jgi:APA family basic amino acid/polyamine antiporter
MARDGLLPAAMARVARSNGTPLVATLVTGFFSCVIAGLLPLDVLGELASIGTLLAFASVCAGVLILRRTAPGAHRPFRTPWVPLVPILGIVSCGGLMLSLPVQSWLRLIAWLVVGALIYGLYGRRHSKVGATYGVSNAN